MRDKADIIVEHSTTVFIKNGLHAVSMDDIAKYSGISKKTLYSNFQSKEMLVKTIVQRLILESREFSENSPVITANALEEMLNFQERLQEERNIFTPGFTRDLKKYYPLIYAQLDMARYNSIPPFLEACLTRGIAEGIFRPEINKANTSWLYCWQIQIAMEGDAFQTYRIIENLNDMFLYSIVNSKGLNLLSMNEQNKNTRPKEKHGTGYP